MGRGMTGGGQWDDERDDDFEEEDDAEDLSGGEQDDELADLDDEARSRVESRVARERQAAVEEYTARVRAEFQAQGFDLNRDGRPLIADPAKVAGFVGSFGAPAAQPRQDVGGAPPEDEDEEIPDPVSDPAGHRAWVNKEIAKQVAAQVEKLTPRIEQNEAFHRSSAERQALDRVRQLLPGSRMAELMAPEVREAFEGEFLQAIRQFPVEHWGNDDVLERAAGWTIPAVFPRGKQQKDERGRWTSERSRNAGVYQESHQGYPDGGRAPRNPPPSEEERQSAAAWGMTVSEARGLRGPVVTLSEYRALQKAKGKDKK